MLTNWPPIQSCAELLSIWCFGRAVDAQAASASQMGRLETVTLALAYNLTTALRCITLPQTMVDRSLTSLQLKLNKIGTRVLGACAVADAAWAENACQAAGFRPSSRQTARQLRNVV